MGNKGMRMPWTLSFILDWWGRLSLASILRLRDYEIRHKRGDLKANELLELSVRSPIRGKVLLRELGSDALTFNEVIKDEVYREVRSRLDKCNSIIDLGANIGLSSLYFASSYPSSKIFAVEPNAENYKLLNTNLRDVIENGRCETIMAAVWGDETQLSLQRPRGKDHFSAFTTLELAEGQQAEEVVPGLSIETVIRKSGFEAVDLLKIDIEGSETQLFRAQTDWLKKVGAIAIEFHGESRAASDFDNLMQQYGFDIFDSGSHTVLAIRKDHSVSS